MKDPTVPSLSIINEGIEINITIPKTQALIEEQGYTYNQAGFTYNQIGVMYGGIYNNNQDLIPITLSFKDIYTPKPIPPVVGHNVAPGWFMYINLN